MTRGTLASSLVDNGNAIMVNKRLSKLIARPVSDMTGVPGVEINEGKSEKVAGV